MVGPLDHKGSRRLEEGEVQKVFVRCIHMVPSFLNRSQLPPLMVVPPAGNKSFQIIYRIYKRFVRSLSSAPFSTREIY